MGNQACLFGLVRRGHGDEPVANIRHQFVR